ncbi:SURF1 family protein [Ideonella sp. DXS29W]|uniref:SURF1-like protein n=1 Tax=Ideonella lacteola TaxID=2984193 RepID=A0ABU9BKQ7_9BURK
MYGHIPSPRSLRRLAAWSAALALAFAVFVALGVWQVQRLAWKEGLIARVEQHRHAKPQPAPGPDAWAHLTREADEYRRVVVEGRFDHQRSTLVTATTELGSGYWVLTPLLRKDGSWLLVNRGFVPVDRRESVVNDATANGDENVIGLLRFTEPGGAFLRQNDAASGRWYSRDVGALAASLQLGPVVAPYFIDQVAPHAAAHAPAPAGAREWPRAGMTVVQFSNNHRIYAATWFALAAMAACAFAYLVLDERRLRSLAR